MKEFIEQRNREFDDMTDHTKTLHIFLQKEITRLKRELQELKDYPTHNEFVKGEMEVLQSIIDRWEKQWKELLEELRK